MTVPEETWPETLNTATARQSNARLLARELADVKAALDEHAIVAITDPQGKITFVNDKFCAISQYPREELIGQDHRLINSGHHSKEFFHNLWTTIGKGKVWKREIKNRAKDGTFYWVDTTIVPFLNEEGKPRQYVAIRADITERKLAEERISQLNEELEQRVLQRTSQLELLNRELEAFSYSVSHDLRSPLRHISGFVNLLKESAGDALPAPARRHLEIISESAAHMGHLIDGLLAFSRMGRSELTMESVELEPLLEESILELQPESAGRNIIWRKTTLPAVLGDRVMLRQVFSNLVANAIKYTRPRDPAVIETGFTKGDNGSLVIYIRDNGVGFDMDYAANLFGVFQRMHTEEEFEGTGIGLANVQRIILRHGGRIWAEAALDAGATFYFTLPHARDNAS